MRHSVGSSPWAKVLGSDGTCHCRGCSSPSFEETCATSSSKPRSWRRSARPREPAPCGDALVVPAQQVVQHHLVESWRRADHPVDVHVRVAPVSYTHLRAHETPEHLVC